MSLRQKLESPHYELELVVQQYAGVHLKCHEQYDRLMSQSLLPKRKKERKRKAQGFYGL
jgi:hypothetical protein